MVKRHAPLSPLDRTERVAAGQGLEPQLPHPECGVLPIRRSRKGVGDCSDGARGVTLISNSTEPSRRRARKAPREMSASMLKTLQTDQTEDSMRALYRTYGSELY